MVDRQPIPSETLLESLLYLDRCELEVVQLTSARFKTIVEEKLDGVCLRPITEVRCKFCTEVAKAENIFGRLKRKFTLQLAALSVSEHMKENR